MVIKIALSKTGKHAGKYEAIVDDCDADLTDFNWNILIQTHNFYVQRNINVHGKQSKFYLHRIILSRRLNRKLAKNEHVDHINNNGLDNRRSNLRIATHSQNQMNSRIHTKKTSGYKGVYLHSKRMKWVANIQVNKKRIYLGTFTTALEAHKAYCKAAKKYFGEFANFGENIE